MHLSFLSSYKLSRDSLAEWTITAANTWRGWRSFGEQSLRQVRISKEDGGNSAVVSRRAQKKVFVAQAWPTFCDPTDCSPPGSSAHRILQTRILEWVDMPFSRGSSPPRDRTWVSCIAGRFFTMWATQKACSLVNDRGMNEGKWMKGSD